MTEESLRNLLDCMSDGVVVANQKGEFVFFNAAAAQLLGRGPTDAPAEGWPSVYQIFRPDQVTLFPAAELPIVGALRGESCTDVQQFIRNPALAQGRFISASARPWLDGDGTLLGGIVIFRDITALKVAEEELKRAAMLLETSQTLAGVGGWEVDVVHGTLFWTAQTYRIHDTSPEEFTPNLASAIDFYAPEWRPVISAAVQDAIDSGQPYDLELELITARGRRIWVQATCKPTVEQGRTVKLTGAFRDITARRIAAEEQRRHAQTLQAERDRARRYFEIAGVLMVVIDADGRITAINKKCLEVLGFAEEELLGRDWFGTCLPERLRQPVLAGFRAMMAGTVEAMESYENPVLTRQGTERLIAWHNTVLRDAAGRITHSLSSGEDITDRRKLEAQFLQVQKTEAIGRLAGGVAHDFNNMLAVIRGFAQMVFDDLPPGTQRTDLEQIISAAERATNLTRQLLAFSRKQVMEPKVLDVGDLVRDMAPMLQRLIGEDIELRIVTARDVGAVLADAGQLQQVVMNLAVNARDAMPDGGQLVFEVTEIAVQGALAGSHFELTPGDYVLLAVSDTGVGMGPETKARLFEPFFTTKPVGRGTGLGLSTCHGIVKQSKGDIAVYSEPGQGTTFRIYLPRVDAEPQLAATAAPVTSVLAHGEVVLLVEDEDQLRAVARKILTKRGYRVLEAGNADQALHVLAGHPQAIHLLLTDVIMPGRNGRELATEVQRLRPEIKVLYVSGYTDNVIVHHGVLDAGVAFLAKPFTPESLARKVREVLGGP